MTQSYEELRKKYLRHNKKFPHVWCPGCGIGIVLGSLLRAVERTGLQKDDIVLASGIGCSGRMPAYVDFNTLHTTHGRALTFATGVKLANPDLSVITVMGDGDSTAIGGNHFIHAARRNLDMTAIIINNQIYGMTGGQFSPTTPYGAKATTASYGNVEHAFSISKLAIAAGASYVARGTVYHVPQLDGLIEQGINKKGFSVIEIISNCHVQYGKRNKMATPVKMLEWMKNNSIPVESAKHKTKSQLKGKFTIGILADLDKPNYLEEYNKIKVKAAKAKKNESDKLFK